jgi:all-trans-retinol dehydrogenase (NAD+)
MKERGWLPKKNLAGQHVFLTGAGSGLGRLVAIRLAQYKCKLSLSDLNEASVIETKNMIKAKIGDDKNVLVMKCDVAIRDEIAKCAKLAVRKFGDVDILINNAGVVQGKLFHEMSEGLASKTMIVNAESHFWTCKEFIGPMMNRNRGHIVSIASIAGLAGTPGMTDYCASKHAAVGFQEALRIEMKHLGYNGITCTTICPSYIDTGMFEGVKCSMLFPLLKQQVVADRIVQAIRQNEEEVNIFWLMGTLAHLCKAVLPSSVVDFLGWALLGWDSVA